MSFGLRAVEWSINDHDSRIKSSSSTFIPCEIGFYMLATKHIWNVFIAFIAKLQGFNCTPRLLVIFQSEKESVSLSKLEKGAFTGNIYPVSERLKDMCTA